MKYRFMAEQRGAHGVGRRAQVLEVPRSGYHAWLHRGESRRRGADRELAEDIRGIRKEAKRRYGSSRVTAAKLGRSYTSEYTTEGSFESKKPSVDLTLFHIFTLRPTPITSAAG